MSKNAKRPVIKELSRLRFYRWALLSVILLMACVWYFYGAVLGVAIYFGHEVSYPFQQTLDVDVAEDGIEFCSKSSEDRCVFKSAE